MEVAITNRLAQVRLAAVAATVMLAASSVASAGPSAGGHGGGGGHGFGGGGHGFGGGHFAGHFGGHFARHGFGGRGGYYGGGRGGYGWRGGHGWRGGYGGWGWGLGLYVPFLPWYYDTYWWGDVPYYYADGNYYLWDNDADAYESVEPPGTLTQTPPYPSSMGQDAPLVSPELFAYPKAGQSEAQQKRDKDECSHWAASQTGTNATATPVQAAEPAESDRQAASARQAYLRAEAACLEARNYSVR